MLALTIEFLAGRYVATAPNDRRTAEWPPHPARVFSALVAAHHADASPPPEEREALDWLERQAPPRIVASEAWQRDVLSVYVPINDKAVTDGYAKQEARLEDATRALEEARENLAAAGDDPKANKRLEKALAKAEQNRADAQKRLEQAVAKAIAAQEQVSTADLEKAAQVLPERRSRKERFFPSVTPAEPRVQLVWLDANPTAEQRAAIASVASKVTRIGHSSSLVACWLSMAPREATHVPDDAGEEVLRTVQHGQLDRLEAEFERHREEAPRVLPCSFQAYRNISAEPAATRNLAHPSVFGDRWLVFRRIAGPRLPIHRAPDVALALRAALLSASEDPIRPVLSGHAPDGGPARGPHCAFVPLPYVASKYADGSLLGVALVLPREIDPRDRHYVLRAVGRLERGAEAEVGSAIDLTMGRAGVLQVQRCGPVVEQRTLQDASWCRSATQWASATPIALDRNPGKIGHRDPEKAREAEQAAQETIAQACENIQLPRPSSVGVTFGGPLVGSRAARTFSPFPRNAGRVRRALVHATLTFEEPVKGPILLGAGRYLGMGLFRPIGTAS